MKIHVVKQGDTLYDLAKKYGVDLQNLIDVNPHIKDPDVIHIGDKIKIPSKTQMIGSMAKSVKEKWLQTKVKTDDEKKTSEEKKQVKQEVKSNVKPKLEVKPKTEVKPNPEVNIKPEQESVVKQAKPKPALPSQLSVTFKPDNTAKSTPETTKPYAAYHTPAKPVNSFYDLPKIPGMDDSGKSSVGSMSSNEANQVPPVPAESYGFPPNMGIPQSVMPHQQAGFVSPMSNHPGQMIPYGPFAGNMPPHQGMMVHDQATYPLPPYPAAHTEIPGWWQNTTAAWPPTWSMPYGEVPKQDSALKVKDHNSGGVREEDLNQNDNRSETEDSEAVIQTSPKKSKRKRKRNRQKSTRKTSTRSRNPWINL